MLESECATWNARAERTQTTAELDMLHITTEDLENNLGAMLDRVNRENEPAVISRADRVIAVIMPAGDGALYEELEDRIDIEAARLAKEEGGEGITLADYRRTRGL